MHVNAAVGFARDGAADNIDDGECAVARRLASRKRGERVGGLAGLRDDEQHGVAFQRRVAITKFVRKLDLHRDLREFLNQILATSAACQLVPLAAMMMRSTERNCAAVRFNPPNFAVAPSLSTRPRRAFSTVRAARKFP